MINSIKTIFNPKIYNIKYLIPHDIASTFGPDLLNPIIISKKKKCYKTIIVCKEYDYEYYKTNYTLKIRKNSLVMYNHVTYNTEIYINQEFIKSIIRLKLLNKLL